MNNAERKNLKQALKIDIDSAYSYMRFALSDNDSKTNKEEELQAKKSKAWIVDSLKMLKKQIKEKSEAFIKEIDDAIDKLS